MATPFSTSESKSDTARSAAATQAGLAEPWSITIKVVGGGTVQSSSAPLAATTAAPLTPTSASSPISLPSHIESNSAQARANQCGTRADGTEDDYSENIASTDAVATAPDDDDEASEATSVAPSANAPKPQTTPMSAITEVGGETVFSLRVSPDDTISALHDKITHLTGLPPGQQRLIYRGRLIGKSDTNQQQQQQQPDMAKRQGPKLRDIPGLSDGHTIHLVKKRESPTSESAQNLGNAGGTNNDNAGSSNSGSAGEGSGPMFSLGLGSADNNDDASSSLLAALLGLGSLGDAISNATDNDNANANNGSVRTRESTRRSRWRQSRLGSRDRRPHYRLGADDLEVPDPGSMEHVRQGLMTIHTLLPHASVGSGANEMSMAESNDGAGPCRHPPEQTPRDPLLANRRWYQGQWLDCRDTVNQWLEATVVEIVDPDEILLPSDVEPAIDSPSTSSPHIRPSTELADDPAVGANDMEGRRRLLLESIEYDSDENASPVHDRRPRYRQRRNNEGVQLLLIHYNGWPHRWDEWIRSDSERIRPFRTRTRHPNMSSTACPTPQSIFSNSPRTNISDGDEADDRVALLPELSRAVSAVNDLLTRITRTGAETQVGDDPNNSLLRRPDLPWVRQPGNEGMDFDDESKYDSDSSDDDDDDGVLSPLNQGVATQRDEARPDSSPALAAAREERRTNQYDRRQLELLAPILDRLGRTLTDAAPHVASFAATLPEETMSREEDDIDDDEDIPGLEQESVIIGGNSVSAPSPRTAPAIPAVASRTIDPDHMDYATGMINTTRGEVRTGPRGRSQQSEDVASLLGAYLAAASLGGIGLGGDSGGDDEGIQGFERLVRERGTGGGGNGGIDIHIHAVVTAGGAGGDGTGFTTLGTPVGNATGANRIFGTDNTTPTVGGGLRSHLRRERSRGSGSLLVARNSMVSTSAREDEGLFAELYSENPSPLDNIRSPDAAENREETQERFDQEESEESTASTDDPFHLARAVAPGSSPRITSRNNALSPSSSRRSSRYSGVDGGNNGGSGRPAPRREHSARGWTRLFGRRRSRNDG